MIALWLACAAPEDERLTDPRPWDFVAEAPEVAPRSADEVGATLEALTPWVWTVDLRAVWDETTRLVAEGDAACPAITTQNGLALASGDCRADTGYAYYGFVQYALVEDFYFWGREWTYEYRWQHGTIRIESPDGAWFAAEGDLEFRDYLGEDGHRTWHQTVWGEYHWDTDVEWLADDVGALIDVENHAGGAPVDGGPWVALEGSLSRLRGDFDSVEYEGFVYPGAACATEPDGDAWLHDPLGPWYRVAFGGDCDGCGEVTVDGEVVGETCPDLSALRGWGEDPWS